MYALFIVHKYITHTFTYTSAVQLFNWKLLSSHFDVLHYFHIGVAVMDDNNDTFHNYEGWENWESVS